MTSIRDDELEWEFVSGREDIDGEFDPRQRYRIYRLCMGEKEPELMATCENEEAVGVTLCQLGRDGEFDPTNGDCSIGVLDTLGETGRKWLIRPWMASPANVAVAGKVLAAARKKKGGKT